MKIKLPILFISVFATQFVFGQLDAKKQQELEERKNKSRQNKTNVWIYDTIYRSGEAYCILKSRIQTDAGDEFVVRNLAGDELIYIKEPGEIEKAIDEVTGDAVTEFSFIKEKQKLNVPKKSINTLYSFIAEQNLVNGNTANIKEIKKLLFVYSGQNPQGYTGPITSADTTVASTQNITTNDSAQKTPLKIKADVKVDTIKYQMAARDRSKKFDIGDNKIKQDKVLIGTYDLRQQADGVDTKAIYTFKLPNGTEVAVATSQGMASFAWDVVTQPDKKRETVKGALAPRKTLKAIVKYLVDNNYM